MTPPAAPFGDSFSSPGIGSVGTCQVQPHQPRQGHAGAHGHERQIQVLLPDHFVIETEHVCSQEAARGSVLEHRSMTHCCATFSFSHRSN